MKNWILALTAIGMMTIWTGCSQETQSEAEQAGEETLEAIDSAAGDAAEVVEEAADDMEESMDDAGY